MPIQTDKRIKPNRPDSIIKGKKFTKCMLSDIAVLTREKHLHENYREIVKIQRPGDRD